MAHERGLRLWSGCGRAGSVGLAVVMVALAGCGAREGGGGNASATSRAGGARPEGGAAIFQQQCGECHGEHGEGGGGGAPSLMKLGTRPDGEIREILKNGKGLMPPQASAWSDDQLAAVIGYVKQLGAKSAAKAR